MNFNDVAIVSVKGSDYRIHFLCMAKKDDAINIMKNSICIQLSKLFFFVFLSICLVLILMF